MYLKGSNWSVAKPKRRSNPLRILVLLILVAGAMYINYAVVPSTPPLFVDTKTPTRSPESFLKNANDLAAQGKTDEAIQAYQDAIKADPRNPNTYVSLARLQVMYGDLKGATENVQNALYINSNHALAHAVNGWIMGKSGKYIEAEAEINSALKIDPNSALAYAYLAEVYKDMIDNGKSDYNTIDKASTASKQAVDLDPNQLDVHWARGMVLEVTGNNQEAINEYQAAITINPNLADLYIAIARNYRVYPKDQPNYGEAIKSLNHAISLRPDIAEPYAEQARTYLTVGDWANGIQMAKLAAERSPEDPLMHGLLGTLYFRSQDFQSAADEFQLAVRGGMTSKGAVVKPIPADGQYTFVVYYARYGIALANLGKCTDSLQLAQQLLQSAPDDETAKMNAQVMQDTCMNVLKGTPSGTTTPTAKAGAQLKATETPTPAKK